MPSLSLSDCLAETTIVRSINDPGLWVACNIRCDFPVILTTAAVTYFRDHQPGSTLPFINGALDPVRLGSAQAKEIKKIVKRLGFRQRNLNMAFCRLHELTERDRVAVMTVGARLWLLRGGCSIAEIIFLGDQIIEFEQLCQDLRNGNDIELCPYQKSFIKLCRDPRFDTWIQQVLTAIEIARTLA